MADPPVSDMAGGSTPPWVTEQFEELRSRPAAPEISPQRNFVSRVLDGLSSASSTASTIFQHVSPILMNRLSGFLGQQPMVPQSPLVFVAREGKASAMTPAAAKSAAKSILRKSRNDPKAAEDKAAFPDDDDDAVICSICLGACEHIDNGEPTAVLECGHFYHVQCFKEWAERDNFTCPLCRCYLDVNQPFALSPVNGVSSPVANGSAPRPSTICGATPRGDAPPPEENAACVKPDGGDPDPTAAAGPPPAPPTPPLDTLGYRELQKLAKARGLRATGKRDILLAALIEHQQRARHAFSAFD